MKHNESIVTQCPDCSTLFKVTRGQLKIADGQVRCGNCLSVFIAVEHIPQKSVPTTKRKPTVQATNRASLQNSAQVKKTPPKTQQLTPTPSRSNNEASKKIKPSLAIKAVSQTENEIPTLTIQREKIILNRAKNKPQRNNLLWLFLFVISLCGLAAQHLWFNRSTLYWNDNYQPTYQALCSFIDCRLPQRFELKELSNQKLIVTSHPRIEGAVTVNLTLLNTASFAQPYPAFRLTFSDLKGRSVANRIFQPSHFLATSSASPSTENNQFIPPNQPTQVSIELMSPGIRAISYRVELLAPEL